MERLNVDIRLNTEASIKQSNPLNPYAVILATGGLPLFQILREMNLQMYVIIKMLKWNEKYLMTKRLLL